MAGPEVHRRALLASRTRSRTCPGRRYGFPAAPGALAAARRPFRAAGLGLPWYAVHGNHDNMLQGTVPPEGWLRDFPAGAVKFVTPPDGVDAADLLARFEDAEGDALLALARRHRACGSPPIPAGRPVHRADYVREHFRTGGHPAGHGFTRRNADQGTAYYGFDHGVGAGSCMLDTVNPHGGWQGSLDATQLAWLEAELAAARPAGGAVQPPSAGDAGQRPAAAGRRPPVLADELREVLLAYPNVIAWVNGHTHEHRSPRSPTAPARGFWQVTTASHIDWPQQGRLIELLEPAAAWPSPARSSTAPRRRVTRELTRWPTSPPCPASWPPTTGRSGTRSPPRAARRGTPADRNVVLTLDWPRTAGQA